MSRSTSLLALVLVCGSRAEAQDAFHRPCDAAPRQASEDPEALSEAGIFPRGLVYSPYLADPDRPGSAVLWVQVADVDIADTGSTRFNLKAGGSFGLYRWRTRCPPRAPQLDLVAGLDALFDVDSSYDNVGWEGNYGLAVSRWVSDRVALRFGVMHTSSHIGDELTERTGRQRIGYTREELLVGSRWAASGQWSLYAEVGRAHERRNEDLQEPWRGQVGAEFHAREVFLDGRGGWYAAVDLSAWEERDYRVDTTVHLGVSIDSGDRQWRLGVEIHDGRPSVGELFQANETYSALGLWLDL